MPDEATREKRLLINDRVRYGLRRGGHRTTIGWLLKRRGIDSIEKTFSTEGRKRLPELSLHAIDIRLDELELVGSIIERLNGQISFIVATDSNARLLDSLPGVAPYTASFLSSAIGGIDRFPDSKCLCAYLGLVPSLHQSGDFVLPRHISKLGDKFLRRNMMERKGGRRERRTSQRVLSEAEAEEGGQEGSHSRRQKDGRVCVLDAEEESNLRGAISLVDAVRASSRGELRTRLVGANKVMGCSPNSCMPTSSGQEDEMWKREDT